MPIGTIKWFNG